MMWTDLPVMLATAAACLPVFFTGRIIARWEGVLFLGYYIFYKMLLVLSALATSVAELQIAMLVVVLPLTLLTLGVTVLRQCPVGWPEPDGRRLRQTPSPADEDFFYHWPPSF
jgi:cation:H+ antiporter